MVERHVANVDVVSSNLITRLHQTIKAACGLPTIRQALAAGIGRVNLGEVDPVYFL